MNVRFDNLTIVHYKGKLQEESHYYPYGLTISSKAFTGAAANNTLYQGKGLQKEEFSNGTGLDWYDFSARAYDAQVGMFHAYDPLAEGTPSLGGYVYCNDNPVVFSDPTGMKALKIEANDPDLAELTRANWNAINGMGWGCTGGGGGGGGGGGWGGYGSFDAMIHNFGVVNGWDAVGGYGNQASGLENLSMAAWEAAGDRERTTFRFSDHMGGFGAWVTTATSVGENEMISQNVGIAAPWVATSTWTPLDLNSFMAGNSEGREAMGMVNGMREGGEWIEHTKLVGEITHNTIIMALGQGFEAAERAAPSVAMYGRGATIMKGAGNGLVFLHAGLTIADAYNSPEGFEVKHGIDLGVDAAIIGTALTVPVAGEIIAGGWFVGNVISLAINGKPLSQNIQDSQRNYYYCPVDGDNTVILHTIPQH